jgi:hypothetical protein
MTWTERELRVRAALGAAVRFVERRDGRVVARFFVKRGCHLATAHFGESCCSLRAWPCGPWIDVHHQGGGALKHEKHQGPGNMRLNAVVFPTMTNRLRDHPSLPLFLNAAFCLGMDLSLCRDAIGFHLSGHEQVELNRAFQERLASLRAQLVGTGTDAFRP